MLLTLPSVFIYQYSTIDLVGSTGNASHSTERIYIPILYHRPSWLNRKCFSLYRAYLYINALPPTWLAQPEMLLILLSVFIYQCSTTDLVGSTENASHSTERIYTAILYQRPSWLNRKCFSFYWAYLYSNALPPTWLAQPEMLLTLLSVFV